MFALCMAFLIFAGTGMRQISNLLKDKGSALAGSDLFCFNINFRDMTYLDEHLIDKFLEDQKQHDGAVISWTYTSPTLRHLLYRIRP